MSRGRGIAVGVGFNQDYVRGSCEGCGRRWRGGAGGADQVWPAPSRNSSGWGGLGRGRKGEGGWGWGVEECRESFSAAGQRSDVTLALPCRGPLDSA